MRNVNKQYHLQYTWIETRPRAKRIWHAVFKQYNLDTIWKSLGFSPHIHTITYARTHARNGRYLKVTWIPPTYIHTRTHAHTHAHTHTHTHTQQGQSTAIRNISIHDDYKENCFNSFLHIHNTVTKRRQVSYLFHSHPYRKYNINVVSMINSRTLTA